jgi:hypothetical protein
MVCRNWGWGLGVTSDDLKPSVEICRLELATSLGSLGCLLRFKPRALVAYENGLVVEKGNGSTFIAWSEIQSVIAGTADVVRSAEPTSIIRSHSYFRLHYGADRLIKISPGDKLSSERIVQVIVERAGLEWFQGEAHGRPLPPMAVKP